jgi:hypothetical protein
MLPSGNIINSKIRENNTTQVTTETTKKGWKTRGQEITGWQLSWIFTHLHNYTELNKPNWLYKYMHKT